MNTENILKLADYIEKSNIIFDIDVGLSYMYGHRGRCGTAGCVAGHAVLAAKEDGTLNKWPEFNALIKKMGSPDSMSWGLIHGAAKKYIGLTTELSEELFFPSTTMPKSQSVAKKAAALVLKELTATGMVNWRSCIDEVKEGTCNV